jgi:hypothetical protein
MKSLIRLTFVTATAVLASVGAGMSVSAAAGRVTGSSTVAAGPSPQAVAARAVAGWSVRTFAAGGQNLSLTVADLNHDGKQDLVVPPYTTAGGGRSEAVAILLGDGDGGFAGPTDVATVDTPHSVAVGDFNGDGKRDLAVASGSSFNYSTPGDGNLAIQLGNGDGTFAAPVLYDDGGSFSPAIVASDLNGDLRLDLAVASVGTRNIPPRDYEAVTVLFGTGSGVSGSGLFLPALSFAAGPSPVSVAVGDFNGDSRPDLAVADAGFHSDPPLPGNVAILLGNGAGTFSGATNFANGTFPQQVAVGDFNGDGRPDLAAANESAGISILLGVGDGTFTGPTDFPAGGSARSVAVADVNRDGKEDLAAAIGSSGVSVLLGSGDATFAAPTSIATGHYASSLEVGDFNPDAQPDLAVANTDGTVSLLLNEPSPTAVTLRAFSARLPLDCTPTLADGIREGRSRLRGLPLRAQAEPNLDRGPRLEHRRCLVPAARSSGGRRTHVPPAGGASRRHARLDRQGLGER